MPKRVVAAKKVLQQETILIEKPCQTPLYLYKDEETIENCITIRDGGYILLDFGRELNGGVSITIEAVRTEPSNIRVVFGESVMEALSEIGEKNAGNYHSVRDYTIEAVALSTQSIGETGFRFVKLAAIGGDVFIRVVKAIPKIRELEYQGKFACSDALLNDIWKTGAYTVQLNMYHYIWDGVKRDRLVWIGDMHPEVSTVRTVFGKDACVPRSLDFVRDTTRPDAWMNEIPTYSMWWILIHYDWYLHWGDIEYLNEQRAYLRMHIDFVTNWLDRDGILENSFVDWSSRNSKSEDEGRKAIFCLGLDAAAKLFDIYGETLYAEKCRTYVKRLRAERIKEASNKRMSALTILSGRDAEQAKKMLEGNSPQELSCFMGYYVLQAKAKLGGYIDALDMIRGYWGAMLKMGATTFWEDFDIDWVQNAARIDEVTPAGKKDIHGDFGKYCYVGFRHSLCHGWASGPTPFLMEQIGGIEILEPGCRKVKISPHLGDLKWLDVTYPTPFGKIKLAAQQENGTVKVEIDAPDGVEIVR